MYKKISFHEMAYIVDQIGKAQDFFGWLTVCVTRNWAGVDTAWEQIKT
ncbi:MAG: hypothetical protein KAS38_16025 [Anaerolineales bacterium]|nr:hypothetical protein [Anaerolineales bacterium]